MIHFRYRPGPDQQRPASNLEKGLLVLSVFLLVFTVTWHIYFPYSAWGRQKHDMAIAAAKRDPLYRRLFPLEGISQLQVETFTGLEGAIIVTANVNNEKTAQNVISTIETNLLEIPVKCVLRIGETNFFQKIVPRVLK